MFLSSGEGCVVWVGGVGTFVVDPLGLIQVLVERLDRHGVVGGTL